MTGELGRLAKLGWVAPDEDVVGIRYPATTGDSAISYPEEGLDVLGLGGGSGFWFDHRAAAVETIVRRLGISSMWEVGAGTGAMAHRLRNEVVEVIAVEPLVDGARACAALGLTSLCGTLQDLRIPAGSLESIGVFDVLEHLERPGLLIDEIHRVLRPGGIVIATVPAFQALWGDEDDVAGHYRRYTRSSLEADLASGGFNAIKTEYLYASLVAPAGLLRALPYRLGRRSSREAVLRSLRDQLKTRPTTDRMARAVLAAESAVARRVPLPFGLTVLGVFCKR